MQKQSVYKLDSKGKQRIWSIWVNGTPDSLVASIEIESGLLDGKKVRESIMITSGKNLGKSNATTPYTQAVSEAEAKLELKLRGEYVKELSEVSQGTLRSGIQAPMLAHKYDPTGKQNGSKTLAKMKIDGHKIHVQPKLDGNRCLIKVSANENLADCTAVMYTRKGDVMPVQLKPILREVERAYSDMYWAEGFDKDSPEITIDGELFSNDLSFNELNGHLKRKDSQDPEQLAKIRFHLYDIMNDQGYGIRYRTLEHFIQSVKNFNNDKCEYIHLIPSYEIEATDQNIKKKLEEFLADGHEGLMIRTLNTGYENKRSWQLVKVKLFEDEEFEVVDIFLDKRSNTVTDNDGTYNTEPVEPVSSILGGFIMKLQKPTKDRDGKEITTFKAGVTGMTREEQATVIANKDKYIGQQGTVEFFGKSEYGVPRFPKFKGLR